MSFIKCQVAKLFQEQITVKFAVIFWIHAARSKKGHKRTSHIESSGDSFLHNLNSNLFQSRHLSLHCHSRLISISVMGELNCNENEAIGKNHP